MFIEIRKIKRLQKDGTRTCHAKQWPTPPSICKVSLTECNECSWHHVTHAITSHRMKTCILLQTPHIGHLLTPLCTHIYHPCSFHLVVNLFTFCLYDELSKIIRYPHCDY